MKRVRQAPLWSTQVLAFRYYNLKTNYQKNNGEITCLIHRIGFREVRSRWQRFPDQDRVQVCIHIPYRNEAIEERHGPSLSIYGQQSGCWRWLEFPNGPSSLPTLDESLPIITARDSDRPALCWPQIYLGGVAGTRRSQQGLHFRVWFLCDLWWLYASLFQPRYRSWTFPRARFWQRRPNVFQGF